MLDPLISFYYRRLATPILEARRAYYRRLFGVSRLDIYFPVFIESASNVRLGENISINAFTHIWANAPVEIGDNTMIAAHVQITTSTHDYTVAPMRDERIDKPVKIGRNVWIGSGAIVFPGVSIGDNTVIGAGALVLNDVPANSIAYGVPARVRHAPADGS
jgi:maltose O-acetyltransferase